MYQVGDIRRRARKRLKKRLITAGVIVGLLVFSYVIVFRTGVFSAQEGMPDTIITVENIKDTSPVKREKHVAIENTPEIQLLPDSPGILLSDRMIDPVEPTITETDDEPSLVTRNDTVLSAPAKVTEAFRAETSEITYKVVSKAYFYNEPDEQTKRRAFINHWNNQYASLKALDEKNDFIYVVFTNHLGQTSKGWLRKKDLREVESVAFNNKE